MKKICRIIGFSCLAIFVLQSCDTDKGSDCFKKQGKQTIEEIFPDSFTQISIPEGVKLVVKESVEQRVILEGGRNLLANFNYSVQADELQISNNNTCGMLRDYNAITVKLYTPDLKRIYSASQYSIKSDGLLTFPQLKLESGLAEETAAAIFELDIDNQKIDIEDNVSSVFKMSGKTKELNIWFWGGNGRFEGKNLKADNIYVSHRSTNDMIVYPKDSIRGMLRSTGNLILKNLPPKVDVEEIYTGKVIEDEE